MKILNLLGCWPKQFMRIMRLTIVIITLALMQVSASGLAQKVSLNFKNVPLEQVLLAVKKQTAYNFVYTEVVIAKGERVNINVKNADLKDVLELCFKNQPLTFSIEQKTIVIKEKEKSFLENIIARFQAIDVSGRITDQAGQPLIGATVSVKNGRMTTTTDKDGKFSFEKLNKDAVLVISYIGYLNKEVNANGNLSGIVLEVSNSKLDEVQVIAYGTTSQRLTVGNITSVKAADIEKQPVSNPLLALSGRVPGLQITQVNGISGGGVKVQIQGQNSLIYGNDPFYVIDGIPYSAQLLPNLGGILGSSSTGGPYGTNGNPLNLINPSDIESIEVLKDASATAIYGSRAANGAILITTKKGKAGKTKVDFNLQSGIGQVPKKLNLLNTSQYLGMRKEAYSNDGIPIPNSTSPQDGSNYDLTLWDQNKNTDWQKELIGGDARYNDGQVSISGGNQFTQFLLGSGFHRETTVSPGDFEDEKGSLHFNINNISENKKFKLGVSGSYLIDDNKLLGYDLTNPAMLLAPNAPDVRNADGSLNWAKDENGNSSFIDNPLAASINTYRNKSYNLIGNANLSYEILKDLQLKSNFGYTSQLSDETVYQLPSSAPPEYVDLVPRKATYGSNASRSWIIEPQINYNTKLFNGEFSALVGVTFQRNESHRQLLVATGFSDDLSLDNIGAATTISVPNQSTIETIYKYNALFGRFNYNFQDKYIADITVRRDGSSRFGLNNQLHNFGALGLAWLFSNEHFFKDKLSVLSFGKLKASYGSSGNDQIGDYSFLSLYDSNNPPVPYRGGTSLQPRNIPNPYLQWEETRKLNLGIDLGFLKDRILLTANYSYNRSSNQLLQTGLPSTTGPANILTNLPATVQNTGLEFSLLTSNINTELLSWKSGFNITIPRNKIVAFKDLESSTFYKNQYIIGRPVNILQLYNYGGVNSNTGQYEFLGKNGTKSSDDPASDIENRTVLLDPNQKFYGSLSNTINYKGFQLDFMFQFVKQQGKSFRYGNYITGFSILNEPASVLNHWQKTGDENKLIHRYTTDFTSFQPAFYVDVTQAPYEDASYVRLKNVSFSWQLPEKWIWKAGIQRCLLFIHGQNLWTISRYYGLDPETLSSTSLPTLRVLTLGTKITL